MDRWNPLLFRFREAASDVVDKLVRRRTPPKEPILVTKAGYLRYGTLHRLTVAGIAQPHTLSFDVMEIEFFTNPDIKHGEIFRPENGQNRGCHWQIESPISYGHPQASLGGC